MPESPGRFGIDIGGTATRVSVSDGQAVVRWRGPSANPASVGDATATKHLQAALSAVTSAFPQLDGWQGWVASAAVGRSTLGPATARLPEMLAAANIRGSVLLSGDVAPVLYGPPLHGRGLVVVAGTGSCAIARNDGPPVVAGGVEYLLSDQGSGFDLGLHGLRAAAAATDGRGPGTALLTAAETHYGGTIREVGRRLAGTPHPKSIVASFGAQVVAAWQAGDLVATRLVARAVGELAGTARAAATRAGFASGLDVVVTGGLVTGSSAFASQLDRSLRQRLGKLGLAPVTVTVSNGTADVAMAAAASTRPRNDEDLPVVLVETAR